MAALLSRFERLYDESKRNRWFRAFAVFCRIALALGFVPPGVVKVVGSRFTGLPSNHPLGHYFDALFSTGAYYRFIGVAQLAAALLLLIPRTALLGALLYFPMIVNVCVLAHAVRFEGTRVTTLMLLANAFLLVWDYDRLKHLLSRGGASAEPRAADKTSKFPAWFFGLVLAAIASVIVVNQFLYDIRPGNSRLECTNGCKDNRRPNACRRFCACIYDVGDPLKPCLEAYRSASESAPAHDEGSSPDARSER